jgi:hypothetical protein
MATGIGPLECPFCNNVFLTSMSPRTKKMRTCTKCKRQFFYYKNMYFVSLKDITILRKGLVFNALLKRELMFSKLLKK